MSVYWWCNYKEGMQVAENLHQEFKILLVKVVIMTGGTQITN